MRCSKCGDEINTGASFCDNCGISLEEYPPVGDEDEDISGRSSGRMSRSGRKTMIAIFVAFDIAVAVFLIYYFTQYSS
jgi:uncharacterized membrane protein YvbJ